MIRVALTYIRLSDLPGKSDTIEERTGAFLEALRNIQMAELADQLADGFFPQYNQDTDRMIFRAQQGERARRHNREGLIVNVAKWVEARERTEPIIELVDHDDGNCTCCDF